jgi:hypothetical protein
MQSTALAQVTVQIQQPPPFQFKLENMWKVTLINHTTETYTVYLHASATELSQGEIVEGTTAVFSLPPGVKVVNTRELVPMDIKVINDKYADIIKNLNAVPSGEYEICVAVIDAATGATLGYQCLQTQSQNISKIELLAPEDNSLIEGGKVLTEIQSSQEDMQENIQIVNGSYIVFSWLPPPPIIPAQQVTYSIKITEILGLQSSYDALQSNPAFYKQDDLYTTIFQFPSVAREFSPGKRYAWQVSAYINKVLVSNSEVRDFSFGKYEAALTQKVPKNKSGSKVGLLQSEWLPTGLSEGYNKYFYPNNTDENSQSDIVFSGSAKLETQTAHRQGYKSEIPERFTNLELYPVLSIFGIPFSSNVLLSTQQEAAKQSLNSFGLNFDFEKLKGDLQQRLSDKASERINSELAEMKKDLENKTALKDKIQQLDALGNLNTSEIDSLKNQLALLEEATGSIDEMNSQIENLQNPENFKQNLERFNLISGSEKFLMTLKTFGIGTTYPSYTPHTLNGVPVSGLNIEVTPAFLYLAFSGTLNQRGVNNSAYRRNLFAGRIGAGAKEESHIHITGLYVKDDEFSINTDTTNLTLTPKANYLFGLEGKLRFFNNQLIIEGETVGSVLTRDVREADLESDAIPPFVRKLVQPKISSSFDFMYAAKTSYNLDETGTKVSFGIKMIGPGFTSLGVPNLNTDFFGYEGKIDQKLFKRKISLVTSFKSNRDNLIDWKAYTTTTTSFNVNLGLRFPNLPVLNLTYSPFFQKNNNLDTLQKIDSRTAMYSVMSSYSYKVLEFQSSTNIVFSLQETKTLARITDFRTTSFMFTQTASFDLPVTFAASLGIIQLKPYGAYSRINTFDFSASFPVFEIIQGVIGFRNAIEKDKNKKFGLYFGSSVTLLDNYVFDFRAESSTYSEWDFLTEYSDIILRATLQATW